ncbi:MAG: TolC family protein [bacterium]
MKWVGGIWCLLLFLATLNAPSPLFGAEKIVSLSLNDCVSIGIKQSVELQKAKKEIGLSRKILIDSIKQFLPQISSSLIQSETKEKEMFGPLKWETYIWKTELRQPLYHGGQLLGTYHQARARVKLFEAIYQKEKNDLVLEIKRYYFEVLKARINLTTSKKIFDRVASLCSQAEEAYQKGLITRLELLGYKAEFQEITTELEASQKLLHLLSLRLKDRLGIDGKQPINLVEEDIGPLPAVPEIEEQIELALKNSPEILISESDYLLRKTDAIITNPPGLQIDIAGNYKETGNDFPLEDKEWEVKLILELPFFDHSLWGRLEKDKMEGGTQPTTDIKEGRLTLFDKDLLAKKIAAGRIETDAYRYYEVPPEKMRRMISQQVYQAVYDIMEAKRKLETTEVNIVQKKEKLMIERKRYELKEITELNLVTSEIELERAKAHLTATRYSYLIALAGLEHITGLGGKRITIE